MSYIYEISGKIIKFEMEYIPLEVYDCYILNMNLNKSINFYQKELSIIFEFFSTKYNVIFLDEKEFNSDIFINLDLVSKALNGDILVISYKYSY